MSLLADSNEDDLTYDDSANNTNDSYDSNKLYCKDGKVKNMIISILKNIVTLLIA